MGHPIGEWIEIFGFPPIEQNALDGWGTRSLLAYLQRDKGQT
jgi:hypothetical protein